MDYKKLQIEITDDPKKIGYAGKTDNEITALLNTMNQNIDRETVPACEIIEATVPGEWSDLSAAEKQRYRDFISAGDVNLKGANTRAAFGKMFGAGTQTRKNLLALQTEKTSRATVLGLGEVKPGYVAKAKAVEVKAVKRG